MESRTAAEVDLGPAGWAAVYRDQNEPGERRQQALERLIKGYADELQLGSASGAGGYGDTLARLVEPETRRIAREEAQGGLSSERADFVDDAVRIVCAPRDNNPPPICLYEPMKGPPGPWLRGVLHRRWIDCRRRNRHTLPLPESLAAPMEFEPRSLAVEPFSAADLIRLELWGVRDRIELLCLALGLWVKIADHDPERWENWLLEYECARGISLRRPFPPGEFRDLHSHTERKGPLGKMLQIRTETLDTRLFRGKPLLRQLESCAMTISKGRNEVCLRRSDQPKFSSTSFHETNPGSHGTIIMNPEVHMFENDPFGYLDDLRDSWADPDLLGGGSERVIAAYRLALAQGRCSLFGISTSAVHAEHEPGEDLSRPMPPEIALAAADELTRRMADWETEAESLGKRWDAAVDPAEGDEVCARLLKFRMDVWAIRTSIYGAYLAASNSALGSALDRLADATGRLDEKLEAQADVLSTLTGTRLLDNWRSALAPEYQEDLPWWLDGSLADVARRLGEQADRIMPGPRERDKGRHQAARNGVAPLIPWPSESRLAAADTPTPSVSPGATLCWISPDGRWRAEVRVPSPLTPEQDAELRPMNFTSREDDSPGSGRVGWVVQVGENPPAIDARGQVLVRLADLRFAGSLVLTGAGQSETWVFSNQGD